MQLTPDHSAAQHGRLIETGGSMTQTRDDRTRLLASTRLFADVDADGLARIGARITEIEVPAGRVIARQGEIGTGFYVIVAGSARVVRDGATIAHLGPGDFFGELSVLDGRPRNATVTADSPTACVAIATWDFEAALLANPGVTLAILRGVAARLRDATDAARH